MTESRPKVFISFDVEADGASPSLHSCIQIGFVVATHDPTTSPTAGDHSWLLERKSWCLQPQPGKVEEERCMREFWSKNAEQLAYIRANAQPVDVVMDEFQAWYRDLNRRYVIVRWVARPASYDSKWMDALYAYGTVTKKLPLPFSMHCISTMYAVVEAMGEEHLDTRDPTLPHTHDAADDAAGQAFMYKVLLAWFSGRRPRASAE